MTIKQLQRIQQHCNIQIGTLIGDVKPEIKRYKNNNKKKISYLETKALYLRRSIMVLTVNSIRVGRLSQLWGGICMGQDESWATFCL